MSSSSVYSSPSTCSAGPLAHSKPSNNNNINNNNVHQSISSNHPPTRTPYPTPPSHALSRAPSHDPAVRRRVGLPYSSHSQPPTHTPSKPILSAPTCSPSRSLITVLPPESLPSNLSQLRPNTSSVYGPSSRFRKGILVPLYPTLAAQLAAISREYGLPCAGGMVLYLVEGSSHTGDMANQLVDGPRISEEAWQILWSGVFEDEREEAFQNQLQAKDLYDDQDLHTQPLRDHQRSYLGYDQSAEEEEVLNSGLEELIISGLNFPHPPLNSRAPPSAHVGESSQEDLSSNSVTLSTEPSPISSYSSGGSEDLLKSNPNHHPRYGSLLDHKIHARSLSSLSNQLHSLAPVRVHSTELPPRPSTSLSVQMSRHMSLTRSGHSGLPDQRRVSSDRASLRSISLRPRRIGAGTIVGKVEFDIDRSRSSGRWYDLWLNPPSLHRNNPLNSYLPPDDHSRPLLLPNLITQRKKSSNCLQDCQKRPPISSYITEHSSRVTSSHRSTPSQNKSDSFLAFDDHYQHLDNHSGFDSSIPGHSFYSNHGSSSKEQLCTHESFGSPPHGKSSNQSTPATGEKRKLESRLVNEQHRQAIATIAAQAKHQPSADQTDSQLYPPIDLKYPQNHTYGLSLGVDSHLELADIRYTQNQDDMAFSFFGAPHAEPTTNSFMVTNQSTGVELPPTEHHVTSEHTSTNRNSSLAIKSNLDELEQALASLSPKALRSNIAVCPSDLPSAALNSVPADAIETRTSSLAWRKRTNDSFSGEQSQQSVDSFDEKSGGRGFKIFENSPASFHDSKHRTSQQDIPVGLTDGYTREDVREYKAPLSPVVTNRRFSPVLKNMITPNTPSGKRYRDGFVTKAAGIMSGKFRNSGSK